MSLAGTLCTAIKSYKATNDDEITVSIGAVVEVLQKSNNGWWLIRYLLNQDFSSEMDSLKKQQQKNS